MYVVLEPEKMYKIAYRLREKSEDYYLFYMCMYRTGYTGARLLDLKSSDIEDFISESKDFLGDTLIDDIRTHNMSKRPNDAFFSNKYSATPLPRRTIEHWISLIAKEELNVEGFGFKTVTKTFYYEYFRKTNYNFNRLKRLFSSRKQYMANLEKFLEYCGLTDEEYQQDQSNSKQNESTGYLSNLKDIMDTIFKLSTDKTFSATKKCSLLQATIEVKSILSPFV